MYEYHITYSTQTEADIFVRICARAISRRVGPGQYEVWLHL